MSGAHDHEGEPVPGLPELLPSGESILWQGAPSWRLLARRAFHARLIAGWFAFFIASRAAWCLLEGKGAMQAALAALTLVPFALAGVGLVLLLAWLNARSALYTVTNRRVVMRFGVALQLSFNLPFRSLAAARLRLHPDGSGDIALELAGRDRLAWLHLWPHARPWRFARAQPMLRALPDARRVAELLGRAAQVRPEPAMVSLPLLAAGGGR